MGTERTRFRVSTERGEKVKDFSRGLVMSATACTVNVVGQAAFQVHSPDVLLAWPSLYCVNPPPSSVRRSSTSRQVPGIVQRGITVEPTQVPDVEVPAVRVNDTHAERSGCWYDKDGDRSSACTLVMSRTGSQVSAAVSVSASFLLAVRTSSDDVLIAKLEIT